VNVAVVSDDTATRSATVRAERLIVFARFPEAGNTKTRLIPALGAERAARLQEALTRRTLEVARQVCAQRLCDLEVRFSGGDIKQMSRLYGTEWRFAPQLGADLGERLEQSVDVATSEGAKRVLVIGTDCPELETATLVEAFDRLAQADLVLGPALDGGYYLIGLNGKRTEFFREIDWGTDRVLQQSLERARQSRCKIHQLRPLSDVDYPEDLLACRRLPTEFSGILPKSKTGQLSIIVPTLNEERTIEQTLLPHVGRSDIEVIIADGGSTDETVNVARQLGAIVVPVRAGRGRQMNAGAALASGDILLFLHADTKLPANIQSTVRSLLNPGVAAGAFRLRIDDSRTALRWIEWGANLRSRFLQLPYGDQGLFVPAKVFHQVGGFPDWPLMEDYELCRRLRRQGRIVLATEFASTSARRWNKVGIFRTTLINQLTVAALHFGVSPQRLAAWYVSWLNRDAL
jgi:rSAM/selenodomain-associated transferase 2/rSAM/selenodomain-associated transferase 1